MQKKRKLQKNLLMFTLIVMIMGCSTKTFAATDTTYTDGDYTYTLDGLKKATIVGYSGDVTEVVIPAYVGEGQYPVTSITNSIFADCTTLTKVTFEENSQLVSIGSYAFQNTFIQEIDIPSSVLAIGVEAFKGCTQLEKVSFGENSQLANVGTWAFSGTAIQSVTIPANVEGLPNSVFNGCSALETVVFASDSKLKTLESSVFQYCESLSKITLPASLERIGQNTFYGCSALEEVFVEDESVLKYIEMSAFHNCSSLKSIEIPATVKSLGGCAFMGCTDLANVTFAEGSVLESLGNYVFHSSAVEMVEIPAKVTDVGTSLFSGCNNLTTLYYPSAIDASTMENALGTDDLPYTIAYTISGEPPTVSIEYTNVAEDTTEFEIPSVIGGMEVTKVSGVGESMPDMPETIMEVANTVKVVSDVQLPMGWSFSENDLTQKLTAGGQNTLSATYQGESMSLVKDITIQRAACKESEVLYTGKEDREPTCTEKGIGHVECTLCGDVLVVGVEEAATGHQQTEVRNQKEATCKEAGYTGDTHCKECETKITSGKLIDKLTNHTWDDGVVAKEATATEKGETLFTCTVCGVTRVEEIAALGMPDKGTEVSDANNQATYTVTTSNESNASVEYKMPIDKSVDTVIVPETVTINGITYKVNSIAKNAFKNNKKLKKITISNNVKTIGDNAFYGCTNLKTVKFGKNVTSIGNKAFYNCKKLTSITIPSKVNKIGKQAFYKCSKLKKITIKTQKLTKKNVKSKAFGKIYSKATIKVPKKKLKAYKSLLKSRGVSSKAKIKK